jgi:hypothetical protein
VIENKAPGPVDLGLLGAVGIVLEPNCIATWWSSFLGRCVIGVSGNLDLLLNEWSCHAMLRWLTRKP